MKAEAKIEKLLNKLIQAKNNADYEKEQKLNEEITLELMILAEQGIDFITINGRQMNTEDGSF